jgi:hypothetical protein
VQLIKKNKKQAIFMRGVIIKIADDTCFNRTNEQIIGGFFLKECTVKAFIGVFFCWYYWFAVVDHFVL